MSSKSETSRDNLIKSTAFGRYCCSLYFLWARHYSFQKQVLEGHSPGAWEGTPSQVMVSSKTQKLISESSIFFSIWKIIYWSTCWPILKLIGLLQTFLWLIFRRIKIFLKNEILTFLDIFLHISKTNGQIVIIFSDI